MNQIAAELDRKHSSVDSRIEALKRGAATHTKDKEKVKFWSAEENALLLEKHAQGLTRKEIACFFPKRSYESVRRHLTHMLFALHGQEGLVRPGQSKLTDALIQRFIDLRLKSAKTYAEIAVELNYPKNGLGSLWKRQCIPILSQEARDFVYSQNNWSRAEIKHLFELHDRGMVFDDVMLQFPSKSVKSVQAKIRREDLQFDGRVRRKRSVTAFKLAGPSAASDRDGAESEEQG